MVDGLTNLDRLAADVEGCGRVRLQLRQGLQAGKHRHGDQLAGLVSQHTRVEQVAEMNRRRISISSGSPAGALLSRGPNCPDRVRLNSDRAATKSFAGRRVIGLPGPLVEQLTEHHHDQERERAAARQLWQDGGWVFASEVGQPINPSTDYGRDGWSSTAMAARYQHVTDPIRREVASRVVGLLWASDEDK